MNLAALRIHARHNVLDDAVLAGRIHRLNDQQHGPSILCVELILQVRHFLDTALEIFGGMLIRFERSGVVGREMLEAKSTAIGHTIRLDNLGVYHEQQSSAGLSAELCATDARRRERSSASRA